MVNLGRAFLVSGAPGAGKSTIGRIIGELKQAAVLDKDTLFEPLVDMILLQRGLPVGARESDWYTQSVKPIEYRALFNTAREVRASGVDVVLSAPFTSYVRDLDLFQDMVEAIGGGEVEVFWVQSDDDVTHERLRKRLLPRDKSALADWRTYSERVQASAPPIVEHTVIDNRADDPDSLPERVATTLMANDASA